jgi:UDP-N-acetylglucosamine acyltransferase
MTPAIVPTAAPAPAPASAEAARSPMISIPPILERLAYRYPAVLVDAVTEYEPGHRIVAVKNVTVSEEFFQGHFPGTPLMPGVLMIESLTQVATLLVAGPDLDGRRARLRGVYNAKFRRQVVPGDRLQLEVTMGRRRGAIVRTRAVASVEGQVVAEAKIVLALERVPRVASVRVNTYPGVTIHETAIVHDGARIGEGSVIGPYAIVGPDVTIGRNCRVGASAIVDGCTTIGDHTEIYPFASIGLAPQDLKFKGERTRLVIGQHNVFREFVTIHRGTAGGGGVTTIGDGNLFMAYAHVAHDCHVGDSTIFGNGATIGGHVTVEDYATISAYSGVHQFCRVGRHAFIGGYTVVTRDALPYAKTVGNRARIYGVNTIGLARRGFSPELIDKLRRAYRHLVQHNTSRALELIERDPTLAAAEVSYLVNFITSARRGVILRRPSKRIDDQLEAE